MGVPDRVEVKIISNNSKVFMSFLGFYSNFFVIFYLGRGERKSELIFSVLLTQVSIFRNKEKIMGEKINHQKRFGGYEISAVHVLGIEF